MRKWPRILPLLLPLALAGCSETPDQHTHTATLQTSYGEIEFRLLRDAAPLAVRNFEALAQAGYYDGLVFHRVVDDVVIQTGDPTGTGTGGTSSFGTPFRDEFADGLEFDRPMLVAMANSGPNTNQSQFFITLAPTPWLTGKHTIFGEVIAGRAVAHAIGRAPTDPGDRPNPPIDIERIVVGRFEGAPGSIAAP